MSVHLVGERGKLGVLRSLDLLSAGGRPTAIASARIATQDGAPSDMATSVVRAVLFLLLLVAAAIDLCAAEAAGTLLGHSGPGGPREFPGTRGNSGWQIGPICVPKGQYDNCWYV